MSQTYEICIACGNHTGKAGAGEDSIYIGDNCGLGPLCEECYDDIKSSFARQLEEEQASPWLDRPDGPGWWWIEGRSRPYEVEADKRGNLLVRTGSQSWQEPQAFTGARFQRVLLPKGDAK